ncbi:MAG: DNA-protecting protein DprA [Rhodanobacteraceae bacterium]|jgi:DNA processing protein|nr:DNA-protecting protein DprA [Rhodanobacteraceae bacterium]
MDIDANRAGLEAWLILLRAPGLGPAALRGLIARYGDASAALAAARRGEFERTPEPGCRDWLHAPERAVIEADLAWLAAPDRTLLTCDGADFPALLVDSPGAPAALFVAGDASALWRPQIAIVGSRNASQGGLANAGAFARALATAGFAITSGLAEGIDGAAHAAALDAGGFTVAVLGTGPDLVYPPRHRELAARIEQRGALVSEFPPGTPGHPSHFPRRNRIIAGLSLGTLVVEAGLRSGSLITARLATEAGREVFAIPGSIHNPLARGCHQLIRQGAKLVETAEEIIAELAPLAQRLGATLRERLAVAPAESADTRARPVAPAHADDPDYARLYAALGHDALGIDQLAERTGLGVAALASMLLMLELEGEVVASGGGAYARSVGA